MPSFYFMHPPSFPPPSNFGATGHYGAASYFTIKRLVATKPWRRRMPHFAFPPSAIIKRLVASKRSEDGKPLSPTARRAGWVGCNFALNRVPVEARISIIITRSSEREFAHSNQSRLTSAATIIVPPSAVREKFQRVKPLKDISVKQRGWTLDVLNIVRRICDRSSEREFAHSKSQSRLTSAATKEFTNEDVYAFTRELEKLHPDNSDSHREQAATSATTP